ncbi:MAG: SOS response-associated peptidase [Clostridia bacterium]|nr:SOS response-associated peptidase [Clostridia bacterium]
MCGRFQLAIKLEEIIGRYSLLETDVDFSPKNEIFPSNETPVIINEGGRKKLKIFKWGFTVSFTKRPLINARRETASIKPTFRDSFFHRRCLIPASGYYEWKKDEGKSIKYMIRTQEKMFSLGGIYKHFKDSDGNKVDEYTILTCEAREDIRYIHERMPLIISRDYEEMWLNKELKDISSLNSMIPSFNMKLLSEKV